MPFKLMRLMIYANLNLLVVMIVNGDSAGAGVCQYHFIIIIIILIIKRMPFTECLLGIELRAKGYFIHDII